MSKRKTSECSRLPTPQFTRKVHQKDKRLLKLRPWCGPKIILSESHLKWGNIVTLLTFRDFLWKTLRVPVPYWYVFNCFAVVRYKIRKNLRVPVPYQYVFICFAVVRYKIRKNLRVPVCFDFFCRCTVKNQKQPLRKVKIVIPDMLAPGKIFCLVTILVHCQNQIA